MQIKKSTLKLNNVKLNSSQIHKFRGYVGNIFKEHDIIHNHNINGNNIYRYPLIQFKLMDNTPSIVAITEEAIKVFTKIFMDMDEIIIDGLKIPVFEKDLKVEEVDFGYSDETYMYEFDKSPWLGLNQKNFREYVKGDQKGKNEILKRVLTGNILAMSKYLDHRLAEDQRIKVDLNVKEVKANLKGQKMIGFKGSFKANFNIPDGFGVGKSVSRGFGSVTKMI